MSLLLGDDPNEPFDYNEDYEEFYDDSDGGTETLSWISWFCSYSGHEYFCEVAEEYIEDEFNLTGLRQMVPHYNYALETILDLEEDVDEESPELPDMQEVEASAERLYGLIHARYIISRQGLQQMAEKYINGHFGSCPRYMCKNTYTVPCGTTNAVGLDSVKLFCPNCKDIYAPASTRFNTVDGAYFGTTFPHMFFMSFPEYGMMDITQERYVPRIFGFKVNPRSKSGPRMDWLRTFPKSLPNSQESAGEEEIQDKSQDQSMLEADVIDKEPTSNTTQPPATHSQDTTNPAQPDDDAVPKQADGTPASPLSPTKDIMNGIEQTHLKS